MRIILFVFFFVFLNSLDLNAQWFQGGGAIPCNQNASINSTAVDFFGNIIIGGYFKGNIDLNVDTSIAQSYSSAGALEDAFLAKYDSSGNLIWSFSLGSNNGNERIQAITLDPQNNIYVGGYYGGNFDADPDTSTHLLIQNNTIWFNISDAFLAKYSPDGKLIWAFSLSSQYNDYINDIDYSAQGKIVIAGFYEDSLDFDPGPNNAPLLVGVSGFGDGFFASYDTSGNFNWVKRLGSATVTENLKYLETDTSGAIIIGGTFTSSLDFDPSPSAGYTLDPEIALRYFLAKYNSSGNFVWARKLYSLSGNDKLFGLSVDANNNIYTIGEFTDTVDFNLSNSVVFNLTTAGDFDGFIAKYSPSAAFVWAKKIGLPNVNESLNSMVINDANEIYLSGFFQGNGIDVDMGAPQFLLNGNGAKDIMLLRTNLNADLLGAIAIGGTANETAGCLASTSLGSVIASGQFSGNVDFDLSWENSVYQSLGTNDPFFAHYDFTILLTGERVEKEFLSPSSTISLFPNPNHGDFFLEFGHPVQGVYEIYNLQGQLLHHEKVNAAQRSIKITLSHQPPGTYWLKWTEVGSPSRHFKLLLHSF
jgi:energy-converting hydrogenase Eha subunit B